jgi:hypothetical protein
MYQSPKFNVYQATSFQKRKNIFMYYTSRLTFTSDFVTSKQGSSTPQKILVFFKFDVCQKRLCREFLLYSVWLLSYEWKTYLQHLNLHFNCPRSEEWKFTLSFKTNILYDHVISKSQGDIYYIKETKVQSLMFVKGRFKQLVYWRHVPTMRLQMNMFFSRNIEVNYNW